MNIRLTRPAWTWRPMRLYNLSPSQANQIEDHLRAILKSWEGTKYMSGQQVRGHLADCIGFAFGVVDEMYMRPSPERGTLPPDTSMHSRELALKTIRTLRQLYAPTMRVTDGIIEPADMIVTGQRQGGPGHIMIAGPERNTIWHCANGIGVRQTGFGLADGYERIFGVYRFTDRERWLL